MSENKDKVPREPASPANSEKTEEALTNYAPPSSDINESIEKTTVTNEKVKNDDLEFLSGEVSELLQSLEQKVSSPNRGVRERKTEGEGEKEKDGEKKEETHPEGVATSSGVSKETIRFVFPKAANVIIRENVDPESEVKIGEQKIKGDFYYTPAECKASQEIINENKHFRKKMLTVGFFGALTFLTLMILFVGFFVWKFYHDTLEDANEHYDQEFVFNSGWEKYNRMAVSDSGKWIALCSDGEGAVFNAETLQKVAQFFPGDKGCRGIEFRSVRQGVMTLGIRGSLELYYIGTKVNTGHSQSHLSQQNVVRFESFSDGYYVLERLRGQYVRSIVGNDNSIGEQISLPEDARLCESDGVKYFGYISGKELKLHLKEGIQSSTLNDDSPISCYVNRDGETWSALGENGTLVLGQKRKIRVNAKLGRKISYGEGHYWAWNANAGVMNLLAGKMLFELKSSSVKAKTLSMPLGLGDSVGVTEKGVIVALIGGYLHRLQDNGVFHPVNKIQKNHVTGAYFTRGGQEAVTIEQMKDGSSLLLFWELKKGSLIDSFAFDTSVAAISFSDDGRCALIAETGGGNSKIHLVDLTKRYVKALKPETKIDAVSWNLNHNVLITDSEGKSVLYNIDLDGMNLIPVESFDAGLKVSLFREKYVVLWDGKELKIKDFKSGKTSFPVVTLSQLISSYSNFEEGKVVFTDIKTHPLSFKVALYGESGLLLVDMLENGSKLLTSSPTAWAVFDRSGQRLATDTKAWNFRDSDEDADSFSYEGKSRLSWSGDSRYLLSQAGHWAIRPSSGIVTEISDREIKPEIRCLGDNCGMNPSNDMFLRTRGNIVSLEKLSDSHVTAFFVGLNQYNWCWMNSVGDVQGVGKACTPVANVPEISETNNALLAALQKIDWTEAEHNDFYRGKEITIQSNVAFSVETSPSGAALSFSGDLSTQPKLAEAMLNGIRSPFSMTLESSETPVTLHITADGYAPASYTFTPNLPKVPLKFELIDNFSDSAVISYVPLNSGESVPEDELRSAYTGTKKLLARDLEQIKNCLGGTNALAGTIVTLTSDSDAFVTQVDAPGANTCVNEIFMSWRLHTMLASGITVILFPDKL